MASAKTGRGRPEPRGVQEIRKSRKSSSLSADRVHLEIFGGDGCGSILCLVVLCPQAFEVASQGRLLLRVELRKSYLRGAEELAKKLYDFGWWERILKVTHAPIKGDLSGSVAEAAANHALFSPERRRGNTGR